MHTTYELAGATLADQAHDAFADFGKNFTVFFMAPSSQELELPQYPGRFIPLTKPRFPLALIFPEISSSFRTSKDEAVCLDFTVAASYSSLSRVR